MFITSSWPFAQQGVDIVGPMAPGKGSMKFIMVIVDYFTKWAPSDNNGHQHHQVPMENCCVQVRHPLHQHRKQQVAVQLRSLLRLMHQVRDQSQILLLGHPQANRQVKVTSKPLVGILKKKPTSKKGAWAEKMLGVLWAY